MRTTPILLLTAVLAAAPLAVAGDLSGRFEPGARYEEPLAHAPANISRMFARTVARTSASTSIDLPAAGGSGMIVWTIPARRDATASVTTRLRTPNGAVLQPSDRGSVERGLRRYRIDAAETAELDLPGGAHEVVHVLDTAAASYQLDVQMTEDVGGVMIIAAEPDSAITMSTWAAPLSRQPGQPITLHAELRDGDAAITGAKVTARLASPGGKAFASIDLVAQSDGTYSATLLDLPDQRAGVWQIRFEAEGVAASGAGFARTGSSELVAERGAARLGAARAEVIGDALRVRVPVNVVLAGAYRLDLQAADDDRNALAWAEGVRNLEVGATELEIDLPLAHVAGRAIEDLFLDVRLLGLDAMGVAGRVTLDLN
jgi:hypothetical protein